MHVHLTYLAAYIGSTRNFLAEQQLFPLPALLTISGSSFCHACDFSAFRTVALFDRDVDAPKSPKKTTREPLKDWVVALLHTLAQSINSNKNKMISLPSPLRAFLLALAMFPRVACVALWENRPAQGVFQMSNRVPANEIASYRSLPDGSLSYVGTYQTGGVGNPDPTDADNLDDLGSSNSLSYHFWDGTQFLTAVNAGDNTISLLSVHPTTLELSLQTVQALEGIYPCSITAFGNKVCTADCAGSVMIECFHIVADDSQDGQEDDTSFALETDFMYDFGFNSPPREGRDNAVSAVFGPGNILFSGDGMQLGILMKGNVTLSPEEIAAGYTVPPAGFWSFPVEDISSSSTYGTPEFFPLPDETLPFAFSWRAGEEGTTNQIVLVVSIAGESQNFPECDEDFSCRSSVTSLQIISSTSERNTTDLTIAKVDQVPIEVVDGCWIEYRFAHWYTGNFVSDSISIGAVTRSGELEFLRTSPTGDGTIPADVVQMGTKLDGSFYLYTENQGTISIGIHEVLEYGTTPKAPFDGGFTLQTKSSAALPAGIALNSSWRGAMGIAATTLSEQELFDIYGYEAKGEEKETVMSDSSPASSTPHAVGMMSSLTIATLFILGCMH